MSNPEELRDQAVEARIRAAAEHTAPDCLGRILASCSPQWEGNDMKETNQKTNRNRPAAWLAAAAAVVLVLAGGFFLGRSTVPGEAAFAVTLDVNPGLRLTLDRNETVLGAEALNEDAAAVLSGMELSGKKLNRALGETVTSLREHGYLSGLSSAVLVTVEDSDPVRAGTLEARLAEDLDAVLKQADSGAALVTQTAKADAPLREKAEAAGVSQGRAQLIEEVRLRNPALRFEDLAALSVDELEDLTEAAAPALPIGKQKAAEAALAHAGLAGRKDVTARADSELEDTPACYEVKLSTPWGRFEYEVAAADGKVLSGPADLEKNAENRGIPQKPAGGLDEETAVKAALKAAGLREQDVRGLDCELELEDGVWVYEVEFRQGAAGYEYTFDAASGALLEAEAEPEDGEDAEDPEDDDDSDPEELAEEQAEAEAEQKAKVTREAALKTALKAAGFSADAVTDLGCEFDLEQGKGVYEVEFCSGGTEYEILIDAESGAVLQQYQEPED